MASGDDERRKSDPDRAAILARRQRFVAVALGGLATASGLVGCDSCAQPCLSPAVSPQQVAPPHPCLEMAPPEAPPEPPLAPPPEPAAQGAEGEPDGGPPAPRPHPCLRVRTR